MPSSVIQHLSVTKKKLFWTLAGDTRSSSANQLSVKWLPGLKIYIFLFLTAPNIWKHLQSKIFFSCICWIKRTVLHGSFWKWVKEFIVKAWTIFVYVRHCLLQIKRVSFADHKAILILSSLIKSIKSYLSLKTNKKKQTCFIALVKVFFDVFRGVAFSYNTILFFSVFLCVLPTSIDQKYLPCNAFKVVSHDKNELTSSKQRCT